MIKILDLRDKDCPEPLIKVVRELRNISKNYDQLKIYTNIPTCVSMIKEALELIGISDVEIVNIGDDYEITIKIRDRY